MIIVVIVGVKKGVKVQPTILYILDEYGVYMCVELSVSSRQLG